MGTDRQNLLKLSARVGLGRKCSMLRVQHVQWVLRVSVCVCIVHMGLDRVCMQGLCGSSGCTVSMLSVMYVQREGVLAF